VGKHSPRRHTFVWIVLGALAGVVLVATAVTAIPRALGQGAGDHGAAAAPCTSTSTLRVTTATSFAPVLSRLAPALTRGPECVRLEVTSEDGRVAAASLSAATTDVWIPDDSSWTAYAPTGVLASADEAGAGTVLATSPIYMVTDPATAARIRAAGGSWLALSGLLQGGSGVRLVVREPAGSGDGLVAAGALGDAVWLRSGMDTSSMAMIRTVAGTRTVTGPGPALPVTAGEVGLIPEYALLPVLSSGARAAVVLTGADRTAALRYTWLPTQAATGDPVRRAAVYRVLMALTGGGSAAAITSAHLRPPSAGAPPDAPRDRLPALAPVAFDVLAAHHADHVMATWYPQERRADLLLVVDVSGSMAERAPGTNQSKIALVRQGVMSVANLLPSDSRLGLWEFGFRLDGARDYRVLVPARALHPGQRRALAGEVGALDARNSGTALYDTILDAYRSAQASYTPGVPNQVLFFTDGHDQDDPDAITPAALSAQLARVLDPRRPVELAVVVFGTERDAAFLKTVLTPVKGYLEPVTSGEQVAGMFVHIAVGGLRTR
jgi:hypothetical protein